MIRRVDDTGRAFAKDVRGVAGQAVAGLTFGAALGESLQAADRGGDGTPLPPAEDVERDPTMSAGPFPMPARPLLSESLRCLTVRALPQTGVQCALWRAPSLAERGMTVEWGQYAPSLPDSMENALNLRPLQLEEFPRPAKDNGRGVHWIPTLSQPADVVDRFIERVQKMDVRWVTFLNAPDDLRGNEYLVKRLTEAGVMPVMRIYTAGVEPINVDVGKLVRHYRRLGVRYFQIYNEPNMTCENGGQVPDAERYARLWVPVAREVVRAGGLPGFGALSPQGDMDDVQFLEAALREVLKQGGGDLLGRTWLSVHNYGADFLRVRRYDETARRILGRSLPQIGTEAGIYPNEHLSEHDQIRIISDAYRYVASRADPYYFAYSLWTIANFAGSGHDSRWEYQALYRPDGPTPLAEALEREFGAA